MTAPLCPCDADAIAAPVNPPQLATIAYRVATFVGFRQAVLTPLPGERTLSADGKPAWRTNSTGDLAVMIAEWFAYIADIVTFYNERIANQDYLRTASLPESVNNLIALLGYRPRPAIGAYGTLAALLSPVPDFGNGGIVLPKGLQFQSKPTPGLPPQIFELRTRTTIAAPDRVPAAPAPRLLGADGTLLLQGALTGVSTGDLLLLSNRDRSGERWLVTARTATVAPAPSGGGQQTSLAVTLAPPPPIPAHLTAAVARLQSPSQTATVWSFFPGGIDGAHVHLASLARQIQPGDWLLFTAAGGAPPPVLARVHATHDRIWDANGTQAERAFAASSTTGTTITTSSSGTTTATTATTRQPIPVPHTRLTLTHPLAADWATAPGVSVKFGWVSVGTLLDQPHGAWTGTGTRLLAVSAQDFPDWATPRPILLQDANGAGLAAAGSAPDGGQTLTLSQLPSPRPRLQPPFLVLPNLLPVTRGKTVANEVLGSGNPADPAQDFQLAQSPVTYLAQGAGYASTIGLTVNTLPWTEVASFYGKAPDATVFVTREDNQGKTHVMFGDGVHGARLPAGVNNVVATYRVGAGAASPPAGKLTVIAQSYPGLRAVLNPAPVIGGADADQPAQIAHDAPRSVLTFGRAVSVFDYQALAAEVASVTRAGAVWAWDDARQRSLVTVYVGDTQGAVQAARTALAAVGDPNRPVVVKPARQIAVRLGITLVVVPGMDTTIIGAALATALSDAETGLFGAWTMGVGRTLFRSQIEAAVLAVPGTVAITALSLHVGGALQPGAIHQPGEDGFFTLDPSDITPVMIASPNV